MNFYYPDRVEVPDLMTAVSPHDQITKLTLSYQHDFSEELEREFNTHHAEKSTVLQADSACLILSLTV